MSVDVQRDERGGSRQPEDRPRKGAVVPWMTSPLAKFIRTGEGILVFAFNLALLIVPIVSKSLSPTQAIKWAGIINGIAVISRTGLKIVSVAKQVGLEPKQVAPAPVEADVNALAAALANMLPGDLARTPSIDQVGTQITEVQGLITQLLNDTGAPRSFGGSAGLGAQTPGIAARPTTSVAPQPPPAAADESAGVVTGRPSTPDAEVLPRTQMLVSDAEEMASVPTATDVANSISDQAATLNDGPDGAPAPGAPAQGVAPVRRADAPAPAMAGQAPNGGGQPA